MNVLCLNCGSEDVARRLPCIVCGSLLFAPTSRGQAVVGFNAGTTSTQNGTTTVSDVPGSAPATIPPPQVAASTFEFATPVHSIPVANTSSRGNVLILSGVGAILLIVGVYRFGFNGQAPQAPQIPQAAQQTQSAREQNSVQQQSVVTANSTDSMEQVQTPAVRVGDRWLLRSDDLNNPKWSNETERTVVNAMAGQLIVNVRNTRSNYTRKLVFSKDWNLLQTREPNGKGFDYAPAMKYFDFPLFPGKRWETDVEEISVDQKTRRQHHLSATVDGWDDVTVPAGTFKALKITLKVRASEGAAVTRESTDVSWYAPKVKRSVKTEETSVNMTSGERTSRMVSLMEFSVSE